MRRRPPAPRDDTGSVMLLVLGLVAVVGLLLVLVVDVSMVLLAQRGVASAADGAAVAAAQQLDEDVFYTSGLQTAVPLDEQRVRAVVQAYGARTDPPLRLSGRVVDGFTVEVRASRTVPLPFGTLLGQESLTVRSVARATSPLAPP